MTKPALTLLPPASRCPCRCHGAFASDLAAGDPPVLVLVNKGPARVLEPEYPDTADRSDPAAAAACPVCLNLHVPALSGRPPELDPYPRPWNPGHLGPALPDEPPTVLPFDND